MLINAHRLANILLPWAIEVYYSYGMGKKYMTAREFAEQLGRPYQTVVLWLRKRQVPGARLREVGSFKVWQIPVEVVETFEPPKPGRPKGRKAAKSSKKASGKEN